MSSITFEMIKEAAELMEKAAIDERTSFIQALGIDTSNFKITKKTVVFLGVEWRQNLENLAPSFVNFSPLVLPGQVIVTEEQALQLPKMVF